MENDIIYLEIDNPTNWIAYLNSYHAFLSLPAKLFPHRQKIARHKSLPATSFCALSHSIFHNNL